MAEHTPGPWTWWTSNSYKRLMRDDPRATTHPVLYPYVCKDGVADCAVSEDDMRLIAAAPEMYEALCGAYFALCGAPDWMHQESEYGEEIRKVREAIEKAGYLPREGAKT